MYYYKYVQVVSYHIEFSKAGIFEEGRISNVLFNYFESVNFIFKSFFIKTFLIAILLFSQFALYLKIHNMQHIRINSILILTYFCIIVHM